jgi:phospholipid/cholesterol/gamma-HCH transport system permease protein
MEIASTTTSSSAPATFVTRGSAQQVETELRGSWSGDADLPPFDAMRGEFEQYRGIRWRLSAGTDFQWDSRAAARLFQCARYCDEHRVQFDSDALPAGLNKLLALAAAVKPQSGAATPAADAWQHARALYRGAAAALTDFLTFVGAAALALLNLARGRANTRLRDVWYFIDQCGPQAIGIVALISVLVGMILAYLGSVQLRQFGAEVYVANLVTIGMVREMGALMTAVIMAGRTGAAYAAQLGAMQSNEEIDAITTLGISPMEYLVLPRLLALVAVMPLLCIFSDFLGLLGGGLVAMGMDVSATQFLHQAREAVTLQDVATGLFKSLVFGVLIAVAGCQAGLQSGRSSAAVGQATTRAVVNAIVYLVVADAALNIIYDKLKI